MAKPRKVKLSWKGSSASVELGEGKPVLHVLGKGCDESDLPPQAVRLSQVHGNRIELYPRGGEEADGMVVRRGERTPCLSVADCLPLFLVSDRYLVAVHAGWRGLAAGVAEAALWALPEPARICVLGPCICGKCYPVGDDVRRAVLTGQDTERHPPGRVDLKLSALGRLEAAGLADGCEVLRVNDCTRCGSPQLCSHRAGDRSGRNLVWLEG
ncbi:hypothetical protein GF402_02440 [Candidatus Fermentibacteria bacterium]|nr:hypothetical protein [Candidatus Fermentibacteria bacterium]